MRGAACGSNHRITVCLVEDDGFLRARVKRWLQDADDLQCVGSYPDAATALPEILRTEPNVVVLGFGLPGMKGNECLRRIKEQAPTVRVLVLTGIPDDGVVFDSLVEGADGFLEKSDKLSRQDQLLEQIRELHAGGTPLSRRAARLLLGAFRRFNTRPWEGKTHTPLTEREQEIMALVSLGCPDKAIAGKLNLSRFTINSHMRSIFKKLDVHSRAEAVSRFALAK